MLEHIQVKEMFKGQVHEHVKFSVTIDGNDYQGLYNEGEINWFRPHPREQLADHHVEKIEAKAHEKIQEFKD
ncbi:YheE family protein [Sporosarcina luteola]|uniref:DUF5342 family protein n=1 Tax=Sporosarcina luteola TaxID=582850 RepID=UPI0020418470|nr:YheE family protein [Sporosarcina luteola]